MSKILIVDGVRYNLWKPNLEVEEFHPTIKEHSKEIFGQDAVYLDISLRLKSEAGIGSEPDGFVIDPTSEEFYIVEVELSKHDVYNHIMVQLTSFVNGLENLATKNKVVDVVFDEIENTPALKIYFEEKIKQNLYKWLKNLLNKPPLIVVVVEEKTKSVEEACRLLISKYDTKFLEFQTFQRIDAPTVHAHLFDTLRETQIPKEAKNVTRQEPPLQVAPLVSATVVEAFMNYKGEKYVGQFNIQKKSITYKSEEGSPSTMAIKIVKRVSNLPDPHINGRRAWKFKDSQGRVKPIAELY